MKQAQAKRIATELICRALKNKLNEGWLFTSENNFSEGDRKKITKAIEAFINRLERKHE
jgi:hypothetical protein